MATRGRKRRRVKALDIRIMYPPEAGELAARIARRLVDALEEEGLSASISRPYRNRKSRGMRIYIRGYVEDDA